MTFFKLFGILLILSAGGGTAWILSLYEKKKVSVLGTWIDLIDYIKMQIDCYLTPLDKILASCAGTLLPTKEAEKPVDLLSYLDASRLYLDPESGRLLDAFVHEIGNGYREEQLKRCDFFLSSLRSIREEKRKDLPARIRLSVGIPICVSLALSILFG